MTNQESLLQIIQESPLSETTKNFFTKKVQREGATPENITALSELLRAIEKDNFTKIVDAVDPNDPKIIAAKKQMESEVKAAADEYSQTLQRLEKQSNRLASDIQEDLRNIEKVIVDAATAEA